MSTLRLAAALALFCISCKQEDGDRCQLPTDCASGYCRVDTSTVSTAQGGGICDIPPPDLGSDVDGMIDSR